MDTDHQIHPRRSTELLKTSENDNKEYMKTTQVIKECNLVK